MIKFNKHNVRNTETNEKARVYYSLDGRIDGRKCVTIRGKDILEDLTKIFPDEVENNTDMMMDYFEKDRVNLFEDHPLYAKARAHVEAMKS